MSLLKQHLAILPCLPAFQAEQNQPSSHQAESVLFGAGQGGMGCSTLNYLLLGRSVFPQIWEISSVIGLGSHGGAGRFARMFLGCSDSLAWGAFPCHLSAEPCAFSASLPLCWRKQQDLRGLRRTWRAERASWIWSAKKGSELFLTHNAIVKWSTFHCICWDKMRNDKFHLELMRFRIDMNEMQTV